MNMKSYESGYKVTLIFCPEQMDEGGLNHILKVLEEPPGDSCFLLVSDYPERIIPTIMSRVQQVLIPPITDEELDLYLQEAYPELDKDSRTYNIRNSNGSYSELIKKLSANETEQEYFDFFVQLMRLSYRGNEIIKIKNYCSNLNDKKQTWTNGFLQYAQQQVRENFMTHIHQIGITNMNTSESEFSTKFSQFIHEDNINDIMLELQTAQAQIEQYANIPIVMFDVILKLHDLLIKS
jgi:DNA polymerase III, gamma/tau subunits